MGVIFAGNTKQGETEKCVRSYEVLEKLPLECQCIA